MSKSTKYFPKESISFWDKLGCFSGLWEQVVTGGYLPIVVIDGENLGTDGNLEEIDRKERLAKPYVIAGFPPAVHIGSRTNEKGTWLYWKDSSGTYYSDIVGVMEVERWFREVSRRKKKASGCIRMPG